MKILVAVEDDEDMRLLIRMQLRDDDRLGVLSEVATADEAIAAARAHCPDLVILDHFIQGQVMGLEAAPMLKVASPTTKILLFSDHDLAVEAAREPAIDAFLPKSQLTALRSTVLSLLSLTDRRR